MNRWVCESGIKVGYIFFITIIQHCGSPLTHATVGDLNVASLFIELYYNHRYYMERRKELFSDENLKEAYLIGSVNLTRNLTSWLQAYLKYQWIHKTSNASTSEFNDHNGMLGLRLIL